MAAAPVRQRCGTGGPRSQLPPCYFEGYLEKRGPKEKVGPVHHIPTPRGHAAGCQGSERAGRRCGMFVCAAARLPHSLVHHSPVSINFLIVLGWARQSERWRCGNSVYHERAEIMAANP
ncbi:hypothetical protein AMECASPLE_026582 [Ameca splendens]|uniref:Uncharacterized protein n=3 Tax=Goodeidae TaxID=28758 RepID=A0ABV0N336_9TELE